MVLELLSGVRGMGYSSENHRFSRARILVRTYNFYWCELLENPHRRNSLENFGDQFRYEK